jgi:hypothetical protein
LQTIETLNRTLEEYKNRIEELESVKREKEIMEVELKEKEEKIIDLE